MAKGYCNIYIVLKTYFKTTTYFKAIGLFNRILFQKSATYYSICTTSANKMPQTNDRGHYFTTIHSDTALIFNTMDDPVYIRYRL